MLNPTPSTGGRGPARLRSATAGLRYRRMPRVLHLIPTAADYQTTRAYESVAGHLGAGFDAETRRIGRGGDHRTAAGAVLAVRGTRPDVAVAWGLPALTAAVAAFARRVPVLFHPDRFLGPRGLRWARAAAAFGDVQVICPTDGQRRLAVGHGLPPDRCHVVRPGVDFGRLRRARDPSLRQRLGLTDRDYVLLCPGESTPAANHTAAVWTCGVLHILDPSYKVLLWGRGRSADGAARLGPQLHQPGMVRSAEPHLGRPVDHESLLTVADACLVTATGSVPTLPIAAAMAAGVPVVAGVTYTTSELLEDRHTALMVAKPTARTLARRVMDLRADPALAARLADTARSEAYAYFGQSRTLDRYRRILRQLAAGQPVDPDEPAQVGRPAIAPG